MNGKKKLPIAKNQFEMQKQMPVLKAICSFISPYEELRLEVFPDPLSQFSFIMEMVLSFSLEQSLTLHPSQLSYKILIRINTSQTLYIVRNYCIHIHMYTNMPYWTGYRNTNICCTELNSSVLLIFLLFYGNTSYNNEQQHFWRA